MRYDITTSPWLIEFMPNFLEINLYLITNYNSFDSGERTHEPHNAVLGPNQPR